MVIRMSPFVNKTFVLVETHFMVTDTRFTVTGTRCMVMRVLQSMNSVLWK